MQAARPQIRMRREQKIPQILSQIQPIALPKRVELKRGKPHDKPEALCRGSYERAWRIIRSLFHGSKHSSLA
jgi:hypothetical protein